jgi:hypothetical protein
MGFGTPPSKYIFSHQLNAVVSKSPPTLNEWYTLLDTDEGAELDFLRYIQTNGEVAPKSIEVDITIDGNTIPYGIALSDDSAEYYVFQEIDSDAMAFRAAFPIPCVRSDGSVLGQHLSGKSVRVRIRMVMEPGTDQTLEATLSYRKLVAI